MDGWFRSSVVRIQEREKGELTGKARNGRTGNSSSVYKSNNRWIDRSMPACCCCCCNTKEIYIYEPRGITDQQDMNDPGSSSKGGQVTSFGADSRYVHDMTANDTPTYQNISPMRLVTMEAAYGDYTIRFRLSTSSTTTDLNEEIIKRLQPLRDRPYSITYEDDKRKQILIACDEDLQDLIMSRSSDDEIKILVSAITTTNQAPVQNESGLTVKASDGNETIKFQLSSSSTFASVEDKIAKSLDLVTGTFRLKYEDEEDELISIKNDEHLRECMSSSRGLNRTTIRMSVQRLENR